MSEANPGVGFSAVLESQIGAEDAQAYDAAVQSKTGEEAKPDPAKEDAEPAGDESTESSEEEIKTDESEDSTENAEETAEAKKPEDEPTTYKVGNKTYADIKDVIKDANSAIGRSGQLQGTVDTLTAKVAEIEAQAQKLAEVNQQWVEWYKANHTDSDDAADEGDAEAKPKKAAPVEPKVDKDALKKELKDELLHDQRVEQLMGMYKDQLKQIGETSHASEVESYIQKLSDKINPETDNYFSPIEAYEYACTRLGLTPEIGENVEAKPKAAPKKTANPAAISSAARPNGAAATAPAKKAAPSDADAALNAAFPLL